MIKWTIQKEEIWSGTFSSAFFRNENGSTEMEVCIDDGSVAEYAEKCIDSFNSLSEDIIPEICKGILRCMKKEHAGAFLKRFRFRRDPQKILAHCYFANIYINPPEDENKISYIVEGEGDWDDVIGFVINDGKLVYVGTDYLNERNWS